LQQKVRKGKTTYLDVGFLSRTPLDKISQRRVVKALAQKVTLRIGTRKSRVKGVQKKKNIVFCKNLLRIYTGKRKLKPK